MYRVRNIPKPPLGIPIGHEIFNTQPSIQSLFEVDNYECLQTNGQRQWIRKNINQSMILPPPSLDSEIFVGRIPRDVFEDELIPLLCQAGTLHELRLLVEFSGNHRGYAFAQYTKVEEAKRAIDMFNNYLIRPNRKLGLMFTIQNNTLYFKNIPSHIPIELLVKNIRENTTGVKKVNFNHTSPKKSLSITYGTHRDAALARKQLLSDAIQQWGTQLFIDINGPPPSNNYQFNKSTSTVFSDSEPSSSSNYFNDQKLYSYW